MKAAFLVGISNYESLNCLPGCANDVTLMESLLSATDNYDKIETVKNDTSSDAVKSVLRNFARELTEQEQSVEELFIYFSGHGSQSNDDVLLCCSDFNSKRPESTSLLNSELDQLIRTINPELTVKVFDACQSGYQYIKDTEVLTKNWKQQSSINKFIFMASCLRQENSFADETISFFTKAFFEGAVSKKLGDKIYYRDIQSHISDSFESYSKQTPLFVTQIDGLEIFGTINQEIKDLQAQHKSLIQQKIKSKSLSEIVLESIDEIESYFIPKEEVDILLKQIEPSVSKINLSDEISQKIYHIKNIDSITLKDIGSEKIIANEVWGKKWAHECFITIEQEPYQVRQLRDDLSPLAAMEATPLNPFGRIKRSIITMKQ